MVVIQPSAVFEGLIVPRPKRVRGFIEAAMWENALELRTNSYDSKVIEDMLDENRSHYWEIVGWQDALKAAELDVLRSGIPDSALLLVDNIHRKDGISNVDGQIGG